MRAKLLKNPLKATIRPIQSTDYNKYGMPNCCHPEYSPFDDPVYEATVYAVWFTGKNNETAFLAIERDGRRLVVPSSFVSPWTVKEVFENLKTDFLQSVDDARRYGLKSFAEDALLMQSNFNVKIVSAIAKDRDAIAVKADYNWELHGHVKPVRGIEQLVCFSTQDRTEILIL